MLILKDIGKALGVSANSIRQILRRFDISLKMILQYKEIITND